MADTQENERQSKRASPPAFEMLVLGSGGGPLETDVSGYLLKPLKSTWEEGFIGLEGGSGIGALTNLLEQGKQSTLFPNTTFPDDYKTSLLKAAYIFRFLTCYLITHAHLDHCLSMILLTGSLPPPLKAVTGEISENTAGPSIPRVPTVYGTHDALKRLKQAYNGDLWPELVRWHPEYDSSHSGVSRIVKRKRSPGDEKTDDSSVGRPEADEHVEDFDSNSYENMPPAEMNLKSLPTSIASTLHPLLPITVRIFKVGHGRTSHGCYASTAAFIRHTPDVRLKPENSAKRDLPEEREILFFGDVESSHPATKEVESHTDPEESAGAMNGVVWKEAAKLWAARRFGGIFIECSFPSRRPAAEMYGHLSPPLLYDELKILAKEVEAVSNASIGGGKLSGLKVFVTHIKEFLQPDPSGLSAHELIMGELEELEKQKGLGIDFIGVKKGQRILL